MTTIIYWLLHFANVSSHPFVCLGLLLPHWLCVFCDLKKWQILGTDDDLGLGIHLLYILQAKPLGMQASIIWCLSQARIDGRVAAERAFGMKLGGWWRWGTDSPDGVASRWIVGASASAVFPCSIKSRRWWAIMEEVDKWCSEFCITVGTATRTAGILIHGQVKGAGC